MNEGGEGPRFSESCERHGGVTLDCRHHHHHHRCWCCHLLRHCFHRRHGPPIYERLQTANHARIPRAPEHSGPLQGLPHQLKPMVASPERPILPRGGALRCCCTGAGSPGSEDDWHCCCHGAGLLHWSGYPAARRPWLLWRCRGCCGCRGQLPLHAYRHRRSPAASGPASCGWKFRIRRRASRPPRRRRQLSARGRAEQRLSYGSSRSVAGWSGLLTRGKQGRCDGYTPPPQPRNDAVAAAAGGRVGGVGSVVVVVVVDPRPSLPISHMCVLF